MLAGTDNKALVTIAEKGFAGRSPRLQIWYDLQLKYIAQSHTEQAFCPQLSTELNLYRNGVLCACKNCLEFFSFQTGSHCGRLTLTGRSVTAESQNARSNIAEGNINYQSH